MKPKMLKNSNFMNHAKKYPISHMNNAEVGDSFYVE